jgi:hypothetical protein
MSKSIKKFVDVRYTIVSHSTQVRTAYKTTIPLPSTSKDKFMTIGEFVKERAPQISKHAKRLLVDKNPGEDGFKEAKERADQATIRVVSVTDAEACLDDDCVINRNMDIHIRIKTDQELEEEQKEEAEECDKEYKKEDAWNGCEVCGKKKAKYKPGVLCKDCREDFEHHDTFACEFGDDCRLCAWFICPSACGDHFKDTGCPVCDIFANDS